MLHTNKRGVSLRWRMGAVHFTMRAIATSFGAVVIVKSCGKRGSVVPYPTARAARDDVRSFAENVRGVVIPRVRRGLCVGAGSLKHGLLYAPHAAPTRVMHRDGHVVVDEPVYMSKPCILATVLEIQPFPMVIEQAR